MEVVVKDEKDWEDGREKREWTVRREEREKRRKLYPDSFGDSHTGF